jgi:cysteine desulfurase/selenocysteine lyase
MHERSLETYRREFPVTQNYIYLDHAGIAPLSTRVTSAIDTFLSEATHDGAFLYAKWTQQINDIRRSCAGLINAGPEEIAFVKNTSHGLSIVAQGLDWKPGDNVLLYEREFPSNRYPWMHLQRKGVNVRVVPSREGRIDLRDIEEMTDAKTRLLALSSVQFSNGFRIDLSKVGDLCRRKKVLFCVDAIQSLGIIPMNVKECNIDFLSADAHKWLLGPEGIGIFYCKEELAEHLDPPLIGWKSVKNAFAFDRPDLVLLSNALRFEEGSMNLLGIFGLGAAIELLSEVGLQRIEEHVLGLGDVIIRSAEERGFAVLTPKARKDRGGNITIAGNFDPAKMQQELQGIGIMVNVRGGGLRISPHFYNTDGEIEVLFQSIDQRAV